MHDINGAKLQEGDKVLVEMKVLNVSADQDFCNVTLETVHTMPGNGYPSQMTLNTKQVGVPFRASVKAAPAPEPEAETDPINVGSAGPDAP
jgi:hypothetical protein